MKKMFLILLFVTLFEDAFSSCWMGDEAGDFQLTTDRTSLTAFDFLTKRGADWSPDRSWFRGEYFDLLKETLAVIPSKRKVDVVNAAAYFLQGKVYSVNTYIDLITTLQSISPERFKMIACQAKEIRAQIDWDFDGSAGLFKYLIRIPEKGSKYKHSKVLELGRNHNFNAVEYWYVLDAIAPLSQEKLDILWLETIATLKKLAKPRLYGIPFAIVLEAYSSCELQDLQHKKEATLKLKNKKWTGEDFAKVFLAQIEK